MLLIRKMVFFFSRGHEPHTQEEIELEGGGFILLEGTTDVILEE